MTRFIDVDMVRFPLPDDAIGAMVYGTRHRGGVFYPAVSDGDALAVTDFIANDAAAINARLKEIADEEKKARDAAGRDDKAAGAEHGVDVAKKPLQPALSAGYY